MEGAVRNLFIESDFFNLKNKKSKYLVSSLKALNASGYTISMDKSVFTENKYLKSILETEDIKYKTSPFKKNSILIGTEFNNLKEAVKKLCFNRTALITRKTNETDISVNIDLDGKGEYNIDTGIGFFNHMLEQIARHANINLEIIVKGDLHIDEHHTVEDTGIVLGNALKKALGSKKGIQRYGFLIPMDESVSICSVDLCGRSYLNFNCEYKREYIGDFPVELTEEFFRAVSSGLSAAIFIKAKGRNDHHKIESVFKAFAKALNEACRFDERNNNRMPSTKGVL